MLIVSKPRFSIMCYVLLVFIISSIVFSFTACKNPANNTNPDPENPSGGAWAEFINLEQYPVTIFSDSGRNIVVTELAANGTKKIAAVPNPAGTVFYPTFHLDLLDMPGISIPYNGPFIPTAFENNKTIPVPIPRLESIEINSAYLKIINDSNFSLTLRQGNAEKSPLGGGPTVIMPNQIVAYEIIPGTGSAYSIMHNTITPVPFPAGLTEFRQGIIYTLTYNGTNLVSAEEKSVLQTIPPAAPANLFVELLSKTSVKITWDAVYGATSYLVYRAVGSETATYALIAATTDVVLTETDLASGQLYFYKASALSGIGRESVQSTAASIVMPIGNVWVIDVSTISITIEWNVVSGASGYNVYRADSENGTYGQINADPVTETSFTDTGVLPDSNYFYKASSIIDDTEDLHSDPISVSTLSPVPVNLRTTGSTTVNISLAWNTVNGASGYNIYRSDNKNGIFAQINTGAVKETVFIDTNVSPDSTYYYKISSINRINSINDDIESLPSGAISAATLSSIPANIRLTDKTTISIRLEWDFVNGASGYNVYRSGSENGTYNRINIEPLSGTLFADTNITLDTVYYYKVSSINAGAEGLLSGAISAATLSSIPANIRVTDRTTLSIRLEWDTVNGASGYNVYRYGSEDGTYIQVNTSVVSVTSFTNTGLLPDTVYYYKVSSINGGVEGLQSNAVSAVTLSDVPANVRVKGVSTSSINLEWNVVSEASGYNVYRSASENGTYTKVNTSTIASVEYNNTGLSSYSAYYYKVSSIVAGSESQLSNCLLANTGVMVPGSSLNEKLSWLQGNAVSNNLYCIELTANESINNIVLAYYGKTNITIILRGSGAMRTVSISDRRSNLTVGSGVTAILDSNITLTSGSSAYASLVKVESGGTLIMNAGSKISGNKYWFIDSTSYSTSTYGGGVHIAGGTFTMNGGEITDNEAFYGLGVYVGSGAFTMNGGKITGNKSDDGHGGGVYVNSGAVFTMTGGEISGNGTRDNSSYEVRRGGGVFTSGIFRMSGGVIYGSNASASLQNKATTGAALYRGSGTAQYGTFNGATFVSAGNLNTSENTIRVVNGNLQTN